MSELPFPLTPRAHAPPGDLLGRVFTPLELARAIVGRLAASGLAPRSVVEPSVGPGAFVRAVRATWPAARVSGVDVDPAAEGLLLADYAAVVDWTHHKPWGRFELALGNPPFVSRDADGSWVTTPAMAAAHISRALERAENLVFVQPLPYLAADWFTRLPPPAECWPLLPRPWSRVREIAVFCWGAHFGTGPTVVRPFHWKKFTLGPPRAIQEGRS